MNQSAPQLTLTPPNTRVRLGAKKFLQLKRSQDIIETFAWATVIFVAAMFFIDGGLARFGNLNDILQSTSRLTALIGTDLLLIHTLLVARVPWLDKLYGHDKVTIAHKKLGKPILYVIAAHFLASLIQFAITDGKSVVAEMISLFTTVPDMWSATVGFVLMLVVVVSSINAARKKLSYEVWYVIHLLAYISILAAVPHQFSTGSDIAGKPLQTLFWVSLYLFVALNVVWYRVLAPLVLNLGLGLRVSSIVRESSDTISIYVSGRGLERLGGQAGQFYMLRIMNKENWSKPHPFSISAAPNSRFVRFTIGDRGDFTSQLPDLKVGTRVFLEGPYGVFTEERRTKEKVTLICAGVGAPPIRALAESMAARPGDITIIYRVRSYEDAALLSEIEQVARHRGFRLHVLSGKRGSANSWLPGHLNDVPDHARLIEMNPFISESDVYICGPGPWTHAVEKSLKRVGTPANQIHAEEFAW
jgi:predicted ferric reductase